MLYKEQLEIMHDFHEKYKEKIYFVNIKNNLGKNIENYKIEVKRLKKYCDSEPMEKCIIRSELCLKLAHDANYIELIKRSMKNREICMANAMFIDSNNRINFNKLDQDKFCYDMLEFDAIKFLSYLRKKGVALNWETIIKEFCKVEGLNEDSEAFIAALLSYPRHTIKFFIKSINCPNSLDEAEYERGLRRAIRKDKGSLI